MSNCCCSFIIPVYNSESYIERCIDSVLKLTEVSWEVILVDDGSTDSSYAICRKYAELDKRIRLFHQSNHGVSFARNFALSMATGDYVVFLDSDDWIDHEAFTFCIQVMCQTDVDILQSPTEKVLEVNTRIDANDLWDECLKKSEEYIASGNYYVCIGGNIIKTDIIRKNDIRFLVDIKLAEDQIFIMDCIRNSYQVFRASQSFYKYYVNVNGATNTSKSCHMVDSCYALSKYKTMYPEFQSMIDYTLLYFIWYIIDNNDVPVTQLCHLLKNARLSKNSKFSSVETLFMRLSSVMPLCGVYFVKFYKHIKEWLF